MGRALVLTGGEVTGALYEVGVLRAVEERYGSPLDLAGAQLTEYGMHDIRPGLDGTPRGYLIAKLASSLRTG